MAILAKACQCKKAEAKAQAKSAKDCSFPETELRDWLKGRSYWNHDDWLSLLDWLRQKGFSAWADCEEKRTKIGQFLEAERIL